MRRIEGMNGDGKVHLLAQSGERGLKRYSVVASQKLVVIKYRSRSAFWLNICF